MYIMFFIYSKIKGVVDVYGDTSVRSISMIQVIQNKFTIVAC